MYALIPLHTVMSIEREKLQHEVQELKHRLKSEFGELEASKRETDTLRKEKERLVKMISSKSHQLLQEKEVELKAKEDALELSRKLKFEVLCVCVYVCMCVCVYVYMCICVCVYVCMCVCV